MSMNLKYQIINHVEFSELSVMDKNTAIHSDYNIYHQDIDSNVNYCKYLINAVLLIPYKEIKDFIIHQTKNVKQPLQWLNKFEKLVYNNERLLISISQGGRMIKCYTVIESNRKEIECSISGRRRNISHLHYINAESAERYFSFRETKNYINSLDEHTAKIIFLTKEKFEYEQVSIDFINPKLPDYSDQCQREIDQIQHIIKLTAELTLAKNYKSKSTSSFERIKINCNINQLVDIFYQLHRELFINGQPILEGSVNDFVNIIVNSFVDKDGRDLSPETVKTLLTPSKSDKRPKPHKRIDIDKLL